MQSERGGAAATIHKSGASRSIVLLRRGNTQDAGNPRVRDELLSANCYRTIFEARDGAEAWRRAYNSVHPHSSLDGMTPEEFLALYEITQPPRNQWPHDGT